MTNIETGYIYDTQIIGGGPAGIGPLVAADRAKGGLRKFLASRRGIALVNSSLELGSGGLKGLKINSNSPGADFLEVVSTTGDLALVLGHESARKLERKSGNIVPLETVAAFEGQLGFQVGAALVGDRRSDVIEKHVAGVIVEKSGTIFRSLAVDGTTVALSRNIILATGAQERLDANLEAYVEKSFVSRDVLTREALPLVYSRLQYSDDQHVIVIGGSHSGFSAAHVLLEEFGGNPDFHITLLTRGPVKVFFDTKKEACVNSYRFSVDDVCPKTGRVNRFSGLRGDSKELYQRVISGQESRIKLLSYDGRLNSIESLLDQAPVIVQSFGYIPRGIIFQREGDYQPLGPETQQRINFIRDGAVQYAQPVKTIVDGSCRIVGYYGEPISGAYAVGLGHGIVPSEDIGGEPSAAKRPVDGVNIFQGPVGEKIIEQIDSSGGRWV